MQTPESQSFIMHLNSTPNNNQDYKTIDLVKERQDHVKAKASSWGADLVSIEEGSVILKFRQTTPDMFQKLQMEFVSGNLRGFLHGLLNVPQKRNLEIITHVYITNGNSFS